MATHPIRFGIQTGQQNLSWAEIESMWKRADARGYDSLWLYDHFYPIFTDPTGPCLEGWTLLGALAQSTSRARIGHLVTGNTYRNPCVLAKSATTIDHVSGGRLNLGIGAGWFEDEHRSFGIDFKTVRGRLDALDEALRIVKGMFTEESVTLGGRHYQVHEARCAPKPIQRPYPPIMIGGTGRKILLRLVARHADMWNASGTPDTLRELIDVLRRHGDAEGRDVDAIEKTVMMTLAYRADPKRQQLMQQLVAGMLGTTPEKARAAIMMGSRDECLETVARYRAVGVTHFIFMLFAPLDSEGVEAFAEEVVPAAKAMA
jgi:F420-dependent oxidoreductase-like protein